MKLQAIYEFIPSNCNAEVSHRELIIARQLPQGSACSPKKRMQKDPRSSFCTVDFSPPCSALLTDSFSRIEQNLVTEQGKGSSPSLFFHFSEASLIKEKVGGSKVSQLSLHWGKECCICERNTDAVLTKFVFSPVLCGAPDSPFLLSFQQPQEGISAMNLWSHDQFQGLKGQSPHWPTNGHALFSIQIQSLTRQVLQSYEALQKSTKSAQVKAKCLGSCPTGYDQQIS